MALEREVNPTVTGRGAVAILFYIPDPNDPEDVQSGDLTVQIKRDDGEVKERRFDLLERLTDDTEGNDIHLPALAALRVYILARIADEVLPL